MTDYFPDKYGVDAVVHIKKAPLIQAVTSALHQQDTCNINVLQLPIGLQTFTAVDAALSVENVDFHWNGNNVFLDVDFKRLAGTLEISGQSGTVQTASFSLEVIADPATDGGVLIRPAASLLGSGLEIPLDLSFIPKPLVSTPGTLKMVGDTLALGLNYNAGNFTSAFLHPGTQPNHALFHDQYDRNPVTAGSDWALALSEWLLDVYVQRADFSDDKFDLYNLALMAVNGATYTNVFISGEGGYEVEISGVDYGDATICFWTSGTFAIGNKLTFNLEIGGADFCHGSSWLDGLVSPMDYIGEDRYQSVKLDDLPLAFGSSNQAPGRMRVEDIDYQNDSLVIRGPLTFNGGLIPHETELLVDLLEVPPPCRPDRIRTYRREVLGAVATNEDNRVDVFFCRAIVFGPDAQYFEVDFDPKRLRPGRTVRIGYRCTAPPDTRTYQAYIGLVTNVDMKAVEIKAFFEPTTLEGPTKIEIFKSRKKASTNLACVRDWEDDRHCGSVHFHNTGPGAATLCDISTSQAGNPMLSAYANNWLSENDARGEVYIPPGGSVNVRVCYPFETEEHTWQGGTLQLETTAGDFDLSIQTKPQPPRSIGEFDPDDHLFDELIPLSVGLCLALQKAEIDVALSLPIEPDWWHFLDFGLDCCPPPTQPYCRCAEFLVLKLHNGPALDILVTHNDGTRLLELRTDEGAAYVLTPFPNTSRAGIQISPVGPVGNPSDYMEFHLQRLRLSRVGLVTSASEFSGLTAVGNHLAALEGTTVKLFGFAKTGVPRSVQDFALGASAMEITGAGNHLLVTGANRLTVLLLPGERLQNVTSLSWDYHHLIAGGDLGTLAPDLTAPFGGLAQFQTRYAVAIGAKELALYDFQDPAKPVPRNRETIGMTPKGGAAFGRRLYLFDDHYIDTYELDAQWRVRQIGRVRQAEAVSLLPLFGWVLALSKGGREMGVFKDSAQGLLPRGTMRLPTDWHETFASGGSLQRFGTRLVSLTENRRGFQIIEPAFLKVPGA